MQQQPQWLMPHEERLAEAILAVVDLAGRVITATPGSHYQRDKTDNLLAATIRLQDLLTHVQQKPVRSELVEAWIARHGQHFPVGRGLFTNAHFRSPR
jgi:hypothetical protein